MHSRLGHRFDDFVDLISVWFNHLLSSITAFGSFFWTFVRRFALQLLSRFGQGKAHTRPDWDSADWIAQFVLTRAFLTFLATEILAQYLHLREHRPAAIEYPLVFQRTPCGWGVDW